MDCHVEEVMYIQTTGIIGCTCAIHLNYQKWGGLQSIVKTLYTSSSSFAVPQLLASVAITFQR